eukprot:scaffold678266_cov57-Prasinocladus_malaysianus.AAC.1
MGALQFQVEGISQSIDDSTIGVKQLKHGLELSSTYLLSCNPWHARCMLVVAMAMAWMYGPPCARIWRTYITLFVQ